ncbi:hypothetical protein DTO027B5_4981 [Paecilomyces variotii]|nr:hypothetical protein DTO027B3_3615 [Paecilomyces variotii]KAJ9333247.1 hypothetical protein DTO027B5_4981 [Paecilomyces variotii]
MELTIADINFVYVLQESDYSSIFQVTVQDKLYVLKVYHTLERSPADPTHREIQPFICESTAYARLKQHGLCRLGVVPDFHGVIKQIEPKSCQPFLDRFLKDKSLPNAILIEYIPDMEKITFENFSISRATKFRTILESIHKAGVYHGDLWPRNLMVQSRTERVIWIDFDRAQTFPENQTISERQAEWLRDEKELLDELLDELEQDWKDGKLSRAWPWYYVYV